MATWNFLPPLIPYSPRSCGRDTLVVSVEFPLGGNEGYKSTLLNSVGPVCHLEFFVDVALAWRGFMAQGQFSRVLAWDPQSFVLGFSPRGWVGGHLCIAVRISWSQMPIVGSGRAMEMLRLFYLYGPPEHTLSFGRCYMRYHEPAPSLIQPNVPDSGLVAPPSCILYDLNWDLPHMKACCWACAARLPCCGTCVLHCPILSSLLINMA